ncbi:hypothetical protein SAMN05421741_12338 [Paenimyroides ummariense]|uniref:Nucleotide-binding universal stress protein, UspA family n=1 Tax=Paenimyroides ummariense TaxID=913024 RepID=A0A1I5EYQ7_9FLAO|nr:hypothetical protein [Paenimyroides ummariense]SFO16510.1 hypothetical protein SAMN05421741_12338 [Paenimyroides ummariense]
MKTIIITTDFSNVADNAMICTLNAISEKDYKVVLFYHDISYNDVLNATLKSNNINTISPDQKDQISELCSSLKEIFEVEVIPYIAAGDFHEQMLICCHNFCADLIVMGVEDKFFSQFFRDNTYRLINSVKLPVLIIPSNAKFKQLKNIFIAVDITRADYRSIRENANLFIQHFNTQVEVLHVNSSISLPQEKLPRYDEGFSLTEIELFYQNTTSDNDGYGEIDEIINSHRDLLLILPSGESFHDSSAKNNNPDLSFGN